jgi:hypothetical protein
MTSITDKLRNPNFKYKAPNVKPTLKNTIYDYKPTQVKNFELARAKYLDDDYKDGYKAKEFQKANITLLEDTGVKNISGDNFNEDPFGAFFGFKSAPVPDRHLDGYYEYNLKGMTNEKFMRNNQLAEGGNMTDLERRLQAKGEFMEILQQQQGIDNEENQEILSRFADEKTKTIAFDTLRNRDEKETIAKLKNKRIEVQKAVRDDPEFQEHITGKKTRLSQQIEDIKAIPKERDLNADIRKLVFLSAKTEDEFDLNNTKLNTINKIYRKYNLPVLTSRMTPTQIEKINTSNANAFEKLMKTAKEKGEDEYEDDFEGEEVGGSARKSEHRKWYNPPTGGTSKTEAEREAQREERAEQARLKLLRAEQAKQKSEQERRLILGASRESEMAGGAGGGGRGPPQVIRRPATAEEKAEAFRKVLNSKSRRDSQPKNAFDKMAEPVLEAKAKRQQGFEAMRKAEQRSPLKASTRPPQQTPPPEASKPEAGGNVWEQASTIVELRPEFDSLISSFNMQDPEATLTAGNINKMNKIVSLVENEHSIDGKLRKGFRSTSRASRAVELIDAILIFLQNPPEKRTLEGAMTRARTAGAGGAGAEAVI